jgi:riboflavin kinase/FMN adenylyltransferase
VPAAALTLEPHPRSYFRPNDPLFRLSDENQKLRLLAGTGLDGAIVLTFNAALANLPAGDFISRVLVDRFAVSGVVTGFDFHFGRIAEARLHFWPRRARPGISGRHRARARG